MILSSDQIRSTQSVAEQSHSTAVRQEEELQILRGTENDANGFEGAKDLGTNYKTIDLGTTSPTWADELRDLIDEVEYQGGDPGSIAVIVDFDTHKKIRNELDDKTRYESPGEELGFGFRVLEFDNVPIFKTHGLVRQGQLSSGQTETGMIAMDMSNHYMAMLQELTVKPLAKVAPQEQFATDAYGTFVSEAQDHIQYVDITGA
jgi:hypothetical protein